MKALKPCGTAAAYRRHLRHDEEPCDACRRGAADARAEWCATSPKRANPVARNRALVELSHLFPAELRALIAEEVLKEDPALSLRDARWRARSRALNALGAMYRDELDVLTAEQLTKIRAGEV